MFEPLSTIKRNYVKRKFVQLHIYVLNNYFVL